MLTIILAVIIVALLVTTGLVWRWLQPSEQDRKEFQKYERYVQSKRKAVREAAKEVAGTKRPESFCYGGGFDVYKTKKIAEALKGEEDD